MEESKEELSVKKILKRLTEEEKIELFLTINFGNDEKAKQIIETMEDIDEEIRDDFFFGGSALIISCRNGKIELVKYLIELGADVNKTNKNGSSPLMKASINGNLEIVQLLSNTGADINCIDKNGSSALSTATFNNRLEIFELLISFGVDIDKCGGMALISACYKNINIVERLIELGVNVNFVDSRNRSLLHNACLNNKIEIVKLLMEHGADENMKDEEGKTPIEVTENEEIKEYIRNYNSTKFVLK